MGSIVAGGGSPDRLLVLPIRHGPFWNVSYVIGIPGREALVIDPAWDVPAIIEAANANRMRMTRAVVTHGHDDHAHGLKELVDLCGARAFAHPLDLPLLPAGVASSIQDSSALDFPGLQVRAIHTPGHTPGSICILACGHLFTGDTLSVTGPGRHGPETGAREALAESIASLAASLPRDTLVHPGHDLGPGPSAELGEVLARSSARTG